MYALTVLYYDTVVHRISAVHFKVVYIKIR
jgi:hypothetical protein